MKELKLMFGRPGYYLRDGWRPDGRLDMKPHGFHVETVM